MARATVTRPSGLIVTVEGTAAEIQDVIDRLEGARPSIPSPAERSRLAGRTSGKGAKREPPPAETPDEISKPMSAAEIEELRKLIDEKQPKGGHQTALLMAYHNERVAKRGPLSPPVLEELWQASGARPVHKMWQAVIDAKNDHGWFKVDSEGRHVTSPVGVFFVEREMPAASPARKPKPSERRGAGASRSS